MDCPGSTVDVRIWEWMISVRSDKFELLVQCQIRIAEIEEVFIILDIVLFTWNNSFIFKTWIWNHHLYELCTIIFPIYRQESWATERLSYLSKITELISSSAKKSNPENLPPGPVFKSLHFTRILLYYF